MSRARLVALPGLLGVALVLAAPFAAAPVSAEGLTITIDSPAPGETIRGSSALTISGTASPDFLAEVHEVGFQLLRSGVVVDDGSTPSASYAFPVTLAHNGLYTVKVFARGKGVVNLLDVYGDADRDFSVAVPPAAPTNVVASVLGDRRVQLSWTGVSHPDLIGYAIYRKVGGGGFAPLAGATETSYIDAAPPSGPLQYQVVSLRHGAVVSSDSNQWLQSSPSGAAPVTVPVPPGAPPTPTPGGETTTTLPPGDASNVSLGDLFSTSPATIPPPQSSPTPTIPDTGFSQSLPFAEPTEAGKVGGRAPGRPAAGSASGDLSAGDDAGSSTNRRALLVPVAAGSVLCVAALHLRWLNRRLAAFPALGADGPGTDLEPAEVDPDAFDVERLPVGAGK